MFTSTDEDKENPFIIRSLLHPNTPEEEYANTEIYISRWDGSQIQRLTNHPGFDGYPDLNSKNADIIFTSKRGNEYPLVILNAKNSREYVWSKTKGKTLRLATLRTVERSRGFSKTVKKYFIFGMKRIKISRRDHSICRRVSRSVLAP